MKTYEIPVAQIIKFCGSDIITSSSITLADYVFDDEMSQEFGVIPNR